MIADGLSVAIISIKDGKKMWTVVAQWLTLLAPPVEPMKQRKRGRPTESTPKTASKRQQLLATQAKERPNQKRLAEKEASVDTSGRPLKIKLRLSEQQAEQQPEKTQGQDPLAALINIKTLEEEQQEDEPMETLLRRRQTSEKGHEGGTSRPMEDIILEALPEEPQPRKAVELAQQESGTEQVLR